MRRALLMPCLALMAALVTSCDLPEADPVALDPTDLARTVGTAASADVQSFFVPAGGTFYNPCTDEFVGFGAGAGFRFVMRAVENDNGVHIGFHENGVRLRGPGYEDVGGVPGEPTGTRYHGMLVINETSNISGAAYPLTYTFTYRIVVDGSGDLPTWIRSERFHGTINADGEITTIEAAPFTSECRG